MNSRFHLIIYLLQRPCYSLSFLNANCCKPQKLYFPTSSSSLVDINLFDSCDKSEIKRVLGTLNWVFCVWKYDRLCSPFDDLFSLLQSVVAVVTRIIRHDRLEPTWSLYSVENVLLSVEFTHNLNMILSDSWIVLVNRTLISTATSSVLGMEIHRIRKILVVRHYHLRYTLYWYCSCLFQQRFIVQNVLCRMSNSIWVG